MKTITIEYRLLFPFRYVRKVPSEWGEVNDKLMKVITQYYNRSVDEDTLLSELFNLNRFIVKRLPKYYKYKLFELFEFIKEIDPGKDFVVKKIGYLKAPKKGLKGVSFERFIVGDTLHSQYFNDKDVKKLNRFIACFYLGQKFNDDYLDEMEEELNKFALENREAIAINYVMIRKWIHGRFPYLFVKPSEEDKNTPLPLRKNKNTASGWVGVFDAMVGDDIGNREKYANLPAMEALRFLDNRVKQNRNGNKA